MSRLGLSCLRSSPMSWTRAPGFVGLLVLAEDLRPHDALLKDPQGLERGVAAGGFGELLEGQEQGDGAEDRRALREGEGVVDPVIDLIAPDGQFPVGRFAEVDADE